MHDLKCLNNDLNNDLNMIWNAIKSPERKNCYNYIKSNILSENLNNLDNYIIIK